MFVHNMRGYYVTLCLYMLVLFTNMVGLCKQCNGTGAYLGRGTVGAAETCHSRCSRTIRIGMRERNWGARNEVMKGMEKEARMERGKRTRKQGKGTRKQGMMDRRGTNDVVKRDAS